MESELRRSKRTRRLSYKVPRKMVKLNPSPSLVKAEAPAVKVPQPGKMFVRLRKGLVQSFGFILQSSPEAGGFVIKSISRDEAADQSGRLHIGQRVYSLNGAQIDNWTQVQVEVFLSQIDHKLIVEVDAPENPEEFDSESDSDWSDDESQEADDEEMDLSDEPEECQEELFSNVWDESEEEIAESEFGSNASNESEETAEVDDGMIDDPRFTGIINIMLANEQRISQTFVDSYRESIGIIEELFRENRQLKLTVRILEEQNQRLRSGKME